MRLPRLVTPDPHSLSNFLSSGRGSLVCSSNPAKVSYGASAFGFGRACGSDCCLESPSAGLANIFQDSTF
jgi:hypothetical protein